MSRPVGNGAGSVRPITVGLTCGALALLLGTVWALSSPLFTAPDEPAHAVRAAATWTGDPEGRVAYTQEQSGRIRITNYEVPSPYEVGREIAACTAYRPEATANCGPAFDADGSTEVAPSTAGFYPPMFYVLVGWPAAVTDGASSMYLMRLVHVVLCSALIGIAAWALASARRPALPIAGLALAVTPMVAYLSGTLNSSGLEIAASIALYASLAALLRRPGPGRWWPGAAAVAVSGLVLCFTRTLSPAYAAVICAIVILSTPGIGPRTLLRRRDAVAALGVLAFGAAVATLLIMRSGQFDTAAVGGVPLPDGQTPLSFGLGFQENGLRQMIGIFGWLDSGTAQLSYYLWLLGIAVLLLGTAALGAWRRFLGLAAVVAASVALPIAANWGQAEKFGFVWQGRYTLPLAVGLPILAALAWDESAELAPGVRRRASVLLVGLAGVGQFYAAYWALRRYAVGRSGPLAFADTAWAPPVLGSVGTLAVALGISVAAVVLQARLARPADTPADATVVPDDSDGPPGVRGEPQVPDPEDPMSVTGART